MKTSFSKETKVERFFLFVNEAILVLLAFLMLYPLLHTLAVSFSSGTATEAGRVLIWPIGFQTSSWQFVIGNRSLYVSFLNSIYITVVGVIASLAFTALFAYPISKSYFKIRKTISFLIIFFMVIRYPLIPYFLTVRAYGLMNNLHVLIITHLIIEYNTIIMRTFFQNLPVELEEAAFMEGANHFTILTKIYVPLSKPVLATLGLFFAVSYWNLFLHPIMFIRSADLIPIQVRLRQFIAMSASLEQNRGGVAVGGMELSRQNINAAVTIFATLPIMLIYPFLQKFFVKGALLGSVKG